VNIVPGILPWHQLIREFSGGLAMLTIASTIELKFETSFFTIGTSDPTA
jgi:hypothetical protein